MQLDTDSGNCVLGIAGTHRRPRRPVGQVRPPSDPARPLRSFYMYSTVYTEQNTDSHSQHNSV